MNLKTISNKDSKISLTVAENNTQYDFLNVVKYLEMVASGYIEPVDEPYYINVLENPLNYINEFFKYNLKSLLECKFEDKPIKHIWTGHDLIMKAREDNWDDTRRTSHTKVIDCMLGETVAQTIVVQFNYNSSYAYPQPDVYELNKVLNISFRPKSFKIPEEK